MLDAGKIGQVVPNRSFRVDYTGTMRFSDTYVRATGGKYRLVGRNRFPEC